MGKIISKSPLSNQIFKLKPIRNDFPDILEEDFLDKKRIITSGTYNSADEGYLGYKSVEVDIRMADSKTITKEGIYESIIEDVSGYRSVSVEIPTSSITITPRKYDQTFIPEEGTYYHEVIVEKTNENIKPLVIREPGVYVPEEDSFGFSEVSVDLYQDTRSYIYNTLTNYSNELITKISSYVFTNYTDLELDFPNCTVIEENAFSPSSNIILYLRNANVVSIDDNAFGNTTPSSLIIYIPSNLYSSYLSTYSEKLFYNCFRTIPEVNE